MIKINLGSNDKNIGEGYINIDALDLPNVDALADLNNIPFSLKIKRKERFKDFDYVFEEYLSGDKEFQIQSNSVDEIVMIEVLEHISFRRTSAILKECHRILKVGGILKIQVPDCGKAMRLWTEKKVCQCVPHKPENGIYKGQSNCPICGGKAELGWQRWLYSFTGAQKHKYDAHLAIFTEEILKEEIRKIGFDSYKFLEHPVKIKLEAVK